MIEKEVSLSHMRWMLFKLGFFKIPLIGYVAPKLISITDEEVKVKIRFRRRTQNHLNSMYFGVLMVGADIAGGILAFYFSEKLDKKISLAFKSVHGEFLKRPEQDVYFTCSEGKKIRQIIDQSAETSTRINEMVEVVAQTETQIVARFKMELSIKA